MKAVVAAFNQEKALVGAFSVITNLRMQFGCNFVQYVVHHEGAAVRAVAVFIQVSAAQPGEKYLRQHHGYQHFWARENVTEPLTELR